MVSDEKKLTDLKQMKIYGKMVRRYPRRKCMKLIGFLLYRMYGIHWPAGRVFCQRIIKRIIAMLEGGGKAKGAYSETLRRIMKEYHGIEIGMYSRGECFEDGFAEPHTRIGRYCSIARGVRIINVNHPMEFKTIHEFAWHPEWETCDNKNLRKYIPLTIGNDVWIGHNAVILPSVTSIGDGAVIGACALVNKNIPPYAVVVGNPARVVRYRFSQEVIKQLLEEKWWEWEMEELLVNIEEFQYPYDELYKRKQKQN